MQNKIEAGTRVYCGPCLGWGKIVDPDVRNIGMFCLVEFDVTPPEAYNMGQNPTIQCISRCYQSVDEYEEQFNADD